MKGYYIHFGARNGSAGVAKKIDMQMKEFSKHYDMEEIDVQDIPGGKLRTLADLTLFWVSRNWDYSAALSRMTDPDFVYMRRTTADRAYIGFLSEIKRRYPKCKIIVEIFTYPYDRDSYDTLLLKMLLWKERHYRKKYKDCIDRFVTYSEDEEIFGVKTIRTMNGIDMDSVSMVEASPDAPEELNMLFVAYMQKQHGFERMIEGMKNYYEERPARRVVCHCVGDGPELPRYQSMVREYSLQEHFIFYGSKTGTALDAMYEKADLSIAALGLYKVGADRQSALKTRESLAKGIPIISGSSIDVFVRYPAEYHLDFSNDASAIDIAKIVKYYYGVLEKHGGKRNLAKAARAYAKEHLDNEVVMMPIRNFIEGQGKGERSSPCRNEVEK